MLSIQEFVNAHVICSVSSSVEYILDSAEFSNIEPPFSWDTVHNLYEDNMDEIKKLLEEKETLENKRGILEDTTEIDFEISEIEQRIFELEDSQETPKDVLEWWRVDEYLAERLDKKGEVWIRVPEGWIWGRTVSGQSISIDSVIENIYDDFVRDYEEFLED